MNRRHDAGFTLVELLVGLALGLTLIAGVIQVQSAARQSLLLQETLTRQTDALLFASDVLYRHIREAGFGDPPPTQGITGSGNQITVAYRYNTANEIAGHSGTNCHGDILTNAESADTFLISSRTIDGRSVDYLSCRIGGTLEYLVPGISDLEIRYYFDGDYQPAGDLPSDWNAVTGVRLSFTAQGDPNIGVPDKSTTITVALRSRL